ncbi:hypothetical protein [Candidatus Albibeggiatoa sp. nov. NOAA]|uniref:hypothetical protein n=1 Tax=Candidatus Albibeggiatoa sp. nov. NOAA TaxID=3162724 RepID=UPI0033016D72|nr:hypothetical protein [Thiotrichaceae bacterium]
MRLFMFLCSLLVSTHLVAAPILVDEYVPFPDFTPAMKCDACRTFQINQDGDLAIKGKGKLWTQKAVYDLTKQDKVIVEAEVNLHTWYKEKANKTYGSLFILGFSEDLQSDILYFTIGCRADGKVKTGVSLGKKNAFFAKSRYILPADSWEKVKVELTKNELVASASGVELIRADLTDRKFAQTGSIGFISYLGIPLEVRNFKITTK